MCRSGVNWITISQGTLIHSRHFCRPVFTRPFFLFAPLLATPLPLIFSALFRPVLPSKSALFCRAKGTPQSLERGSFRMDLSTKFGKEIPSRNLRKKRSGLTPSVNLNLGAPEKVYVPHFLERNPKRDPRKLFRGIMEPTQFVVFGGSFFAYS